MNYRNLMLVGVCGLCWMGFTSDVRAEAEETAAAAALEESAKTAEQTTQDAAEAVERAVKTVETIGQEVDAAAHAQAMADWMKLASPNENHAKLDAFLGTWDTTTHFWMTPGAPPQVSTGASEIKSILDGRFIQENFEGTMQMPGSEPQPFKGMGITGYDNAKGEYTGIWADTMSTAVISSAGQFDDSTQTLTLTGHVDCPMDGPSDMRMTYVIISPDELKLEGFKTVEGREEAKVMQVVYKRRY